ncbi:hypothetical protein BGZ61DRAFT_22516 [Ilyonectria robusta]|uniref:uncharacterized protein n=1 Tax=Ilyonectria robusta TaxID=1079257 RepID=UPI001E8E8E28|nr:uncharacterized protein BGZ61DRAFT_22516 [Ilyonectria robusta]KAH8737782.1 hypothetical protein BGZ61DRAFT_22516 [Ilyonectria robusta]
MAVRGSFLYGPSTRTLILSLLIATPADLPSFWICLFFSIRPLVYIHDSDTLTQFPRHISFYTTITVLVLYGRDGILGYITIFNLGREVHQSLFFSSGIRRIQLSKASTARSLHFGLAKISISTHGHPNTEDGGIVRRKLWDAAKDGWNSLRAWRAFTDGTYTTSVWR